MKPIDLIELKHKLLVGCTQARLPYMMPVAKVTDTSTVN